MAVGACLPAARHITLKVDEELYSQILLGTRQLSKMSKGFERREW